MKLWSESWAHGAAIPARYAAGWRDATGAVGFSDNVSPHLAWDEVPVGAQSFALVVHDPDVPSRGDDVNQADREVPADLPRVDFFHAVILDLPPTLRALAEGELSRGFTPRGKSGPACCHGARAGVNDYTGWFAGNGEMAGDYYGYDGPFPPFNDARLHHYLFTLYALNVPRLPLQGRFDGREAVAALAPYVLDSAQFSGTYTLNPRLQSAAG
jgi:Raf kinase inhibitor-like YbhB/YbcL family protein